MNGRGERIRTSDPHNPIVVRYQAALRPDRILGTKKEVSTDAESLELVQVLFVTA